MMAPLFTAPSNERMINDIAVGLVLVSGPGDLAISDDEAVNILAEVQEGHSLLAGFEPNAKTTWSYDIREVSVSITPWQGARWPGMPASFYKGIDAALMRDDNGKIYFFKGSEYVRFSNVSDGVDAGYPKPIAGNWKGLPSTFTSGIDAALWRQSNGKIYLFKGNQYVRISKVEDGMDAGYPKPIAGNWPGMPADFMIYGLAARIAAPITATVITMTINFRSSFFSKRIGRRRLAKGAPTIARPIAA